MSTRSNREESVPAEWKEGDVILGVYEVKRLLGRGGMGTVFQVYHRGWDMDLAVKWPKPDTLAAARGADLFERECETWVNLGLHPNVTSCYYVRRLGGVPRVFAEFVGGGNLSFWIRHGKLYSGPEPLAAMLDTLIQIAWGLRYAHAQGIIHLDMKSANVLMTVDGVAKVTDFGLARALHVATSVEGERPKRGDYEGALKMLRLIKGSAIDGHEVRTAWSEAESSLDKSRRLVCEFGAAGSGVTAMCLSGDGQLALTASSTQAGDGQVSVWDTATGACRRTLDGHRGAVKSVALSADGMHALTGGADGTARSWRIATGTCEHALVAHQGGVEAVMFGDDGQLVFTGGADGLVRAWDRTTGEKRATFTGHKRAITGLCYGAYGMSFLSAGADNALIHWDLKQGTQLGAIHSFESPLLCVATSGDRRYLLAGSQDGFLEYLDLTTGKRLGRRRGHSEPIVAVCLSKRGQFALSGGHQGKMRLWETANHRCLFTYKASAPLAVSADGQLALTAGEAGLKLWYVGFETPIHHAPLMVCRA